MSAIAIANITITLRAWDVHYPPNEIKSYPTMAFGNGVLTYDTYGIPIPSLGDLGMQKGITRIHIQAPPDGYFYVYDPTVRTANPVAPYGTIRFFKSKGSAGAMTEFSGAVPATSLPLTVFGN